MDTAAHESALRQHIGDFLGRDLDSLAASADLVAELGLDSLTGLQVLALVEKRFDVRFPERELATLRSIDALSAAIERQQKGAQ